MSFRQTYKGIFQFKDQAALERAMAENQAEALGADSMGLQDGYRSEGVMLFNIDGLANEQDWDEMSVALATLAMHASRGFLFAVAFDKDNGKKSIVEYYEGTNGAKKPLPRQSENGPVLADDYFPFVAGSKYRYKAAGLPVPSISWTVQKLLVNDHEYFYFDNPNLPGLHYNEFWDSAYFNKDRAHIFTVNQGNEMELQQVEPDNPRSFQLVYNNEGKPGDVLYAIWKSGDYFVVHTREGDIDLSLPAGEFKDCMTVKVELYHVHEENMVVDQHLQYFAKGVGLVKWVKNESSIELQEYSIGG